ncbi:MAG: hypothetical protein E6I73_16880 [Chloroflexi bacterium]|nr:MAG: hypothetical protein E6I73_16880 [Chloroflexota bacterium]
MLHRERPPRARRGRIPPRRAPWIRRGLGRRDEPALPRRGGCHTRRRAPRRGRDRRGARARGRHARALAAARAVALQPPGRSGRLTGPRPGCQRG